MAASTSIMQSDKERVINMLINHLGLAFDNPKHKQRIIEQLSHLSYNQLIRPLVLKDRENGMSYGRISVKYKVTYDTIRYILSL